MLNELLIVLYRG
jgi:hypothetical protein